ncbi:MAG: PQQ-dependent sugar dehydrogenase [bacterium]|nr:PQQ-dependent sugar dehydrogenase [bacterium]
MACLLSCIAALPSAAQIPDYLALTPVLSGLTRPIAIRHAGDGSGRLFIVEQAGRILVWDGVSAPTSFLDITTLVDDTSLEQGLLGLDFHPDFATNGHFFVNYTRDPGPGADRTVVARYSVSAEDPDVADPASATTILEIEQGFSNHNGGNLLFGPDGYLYIGMGDGGSQFDSLARAQDSSTPLGKMLRIDPDGSPAAANEICGLQAAYGIPPGNPFAGIGDGCDEIWALGLRNPWRWSFDRMTGDMFIGDVGQSSMEEISFQPAGVGGLNFGWSCREGSLVQDFNPCLPGPLTDPILTYLHNDGLFNGCAVTGGYRYRGGISGLQGTYVYSDGCTGNIWLATEDSPGQWSATLWQSTGRSIVSFGEDESGELYALDHGGIVLRFEADCMPSPTTLCLNDNRFKVEVDWETSTETGRAQVVPGGTDDSSNLWFFSPSNWEMLIKVLDGCAINEHFWVFFAATTDVGLTVTVTDTQEGQVRVYTNPLDQPANAVTDASAFATCP